MEEDGWATILANKFPFLIVSCLLGVQVCVWGVGGKDTALLLYNNLFFTNESYLFCVQNIFFPRAANYH